MNYGPTFAGKVALITGGSSGIGAATATLFGALGARVAVGYLSNCEGARVVVDGVVRGGGNAAAFKADVRRAEDVRRLVESVETAVGAIDVLVNNAGALVGRYGVEALDDSRWDEVLDTNLTSAMRCSRAVLASMRARRTGAIVNVGSIAAHTGGGAGAAAYATAKAGLIGLTKALAKEVAAERIRVNAVSPGVIDTAMQRHHSPPGRLERIVESIPLGRLGTAEECAHVIAFLASDAASYIVGETIEVNGGLLMR